MKYNKIIFLFSILQFSYCTNNQDVTEKNNQKISKVEKPLNDNLKVELPDVFANKKQENSFKRLVGHDYKLFITDFATISQDEDLDSINAKVYSGMVPGLGTINECIVMIINDDTFMAAIIKDDNIVYYSNYNKFSKVIPVTIKSWIEQKGEKTIQIMNLKPGN